ncbi:MAG TPA: NAD(P)H-hydrate dehydratase [Smithella sp.]|nr:NAD(P)H-hydrate dehydratase [Smithella sp.]
MLLICGTIPQENPALIQGEAIFDDGRLFVQGREIACTQGTAALVSAASMTARQLGDKNPHVVLAGDTGGGKGSRLLYDDLIDHLVEKSPDVLLMHYILPVMGLMRKVYASASRCPKMPVMLADASSMYAAKAAGLAPKFDVFTPDACEMAFLADPDAVHPAYISHHLFRAETAQVPELIARACRGKNAAKILVVKGSTDYVVENGKITFTISEPDLPALEAIGGTGDTISGMIGAMIDAGLSHRNAAVAALKANRLAGQIAKATPATKIRRIVEVIPEALKNIL